MRVTVLLAATLFLFCPGGSADSSVDAGPVTIFVADGRGEACKPIAGAVCAAEASGDSLGNSTLDLYQDLQVVGVNINGTDLLTSWLLPDGALVVRAGEFYLVNPISRPATEWWAENEPKHPADDKAGLILNESAIAVRFFGPDPKDPDAAWSEHDGLGLAYANQGQGPGYERIGPFNAPTGSDTDTYAAPFDETLCDYWQSAECNETVKTYVDTYEANTPNVVFGLEIYDIGVGNVSPPTPEAELDRSGPVAPDTYAANPHSPRLALTPQDSRGLNLQLYSTTATQPEGSAPKPRDQPDTLGAAAAAPVAKMPTGIPELVTRLAVATALAAVLASLYSRFTSREQVMQHDARKKLLEILSKTPGMHLSQIARELGVTRNAAAYHIRVLGKMRLVETRGVEGALHVFASGSAALKKENELAEQRHPTRAALLAALRQSPMGLTRADLHAAAGDAPTRTRNYTIKSMVQRGVIEAHTGDDGAERYRIATGTTIV